METLTAPAGRWLVALALALAVAAPGAHGQQASEPAIKAAFLHKFLGYVEWPAAALPAPEAPFVIAVSGGEEVASELERIVQGRNINNRRVVVRRLADGERFASAHLLFVARGEPAARAMFRAAQQQGVLAVTESERGLDQGAAISFVVAEDRVGFEVSTEAAERAGLKISSRMLAVARRVVAR